MILDTQTYQRYLIWNLFGRNEILQALNDKIAHQTVHQEICKINDKIQRLRNSQKATNQDLQEESHTTATSEKMFWYANNFKRSQSYVYSW